VTSIGAADAYGFLTHLSIMARPHLCIQFFCGCPDMRIGLSLLGCVVLLPQLLAAQTVRADTLEGRLITDSARAIPDGEVIVTRGPDRAVFRVRTDTAGRWRVVSEPGTGDYLVYATAPGRGFSRRRVMRVDFETRFLINVKLSLVDAATLTTIEVRGTRRERVGTETDATRPPQGEAALTSHAVSGAVAPSAAGNILAMAATIPGYRSGPDGISVLGLPASQSLVTLNGLAFVGAELPRGAASSVRATTTTWDIARGGFSGAQVDVSLAQGSADASRQVFVTGDAPTLQVTDAAGRALGARLARLDANVALRGPLTRDERFVYSTAARVRRTVADVPSLLTASRAALSAAGVSADLVAPLIADLTALGIAPGSKDGMQRTDVQLIGRIDRLSYNSETFEPVPHTYGALLFLDVRRDQGVGIGATAFPSTAASTRDVAGALQLFHSLQTRYWLHESNVAVSLRETKTDPSVRVPAGTVRTTGASAEEGGIVDIAFGGNGLLARNSRRATFEASQTTQTFLGPGTRHRLKLFAQGRWDASVDQAAPNAFGSFSYNSLADLTANRPAAFARTLSLPTRQGAVINGAVGIGSILRTSSLFSLQYGVRIEGNAFLVTPVANRALAQALGVRTDVAPSDIGVSPRLGFRWVRSRRPRDGGSLVATPYGVQATDVRGVLRGGIGAFRGYIAPELVAGAVAASGLPYSTLRLLCVGAAVPSPEWGEYAAAESAIPHDCVEGAPTLADRTPGVRTLDPSYRPPLSWRANLSWSTRLLGTDIAVEAIGSLNVAQPSSRNLNFTGAPKFVLARESQRSVFVSESSVIGATGAVSVVESRRDTTFGSVVVTGADARSTSAQLRLTLTPPTRLLNRVFNTRVSWVVGQHRSRESGFDRNTAGDPRGFEWAPGNLDVRHEVQVQGAVNLGKGFGMTIFVNAGSGAPFTPLVSGDINGDGISDNDRAFVTRGAASDTSVRSAMLALLESAPSRIRSCLTQSLDRISSRNGCRGPWTARLNTQFLIPTGWIPFGQRTRLNVFVENPLAGLDRLVNGSELRGWGTVSIPDPILYVVRGFDPAARQFLYAVNPRFGATSPRLTSLRAPFRLTLELQTSFAPPLPRQMLTRALRNGRSGDSRPRRTPQEIALLYATDVPNQYDGLLELTDSLLLTKAQVAALQAANVVYMARRDSAWLALGKDLSTFDDRYEVRAGLARQATATESVWQLAYDEAKKLDTMLNATQLQMLPWPSSYLRRLKPGEKIRY
jgi:hypothetical protein